jgi:hypothetical protein
VTLTSDLVDQFDLQWQEALRPRLHEMTDEVYLWEPVPGCWSLRRRDSRARTAG